MKGSARQMRTLLGAALLAVMALIPACKKEIPLPGPSTRSSEVAQLPPKPNLQRPAIKEKHPDGAYTVEGLLAHRDKHLGEKLTVRAKVVRVTKCAPKEPIAPPPNPDGTLSPDAIDALPPLPPTNCDPPPSAYLIDDPPQSRRELLVYGTMRSAIAGFEAGQVVQVEGTFDIISSDGVFLRQAGLLQLPDVVLEPTEPAPAPEGAPPTPR